MTGKQSSTRVSFLPQDASSDLNSDLLSLDSTPDAQQSRNLVLTFDGTGQVFSSMLTSIPLLYSFLSTDPKEQLCYYQTGVGTDLGSHVQDAYVFLMQNYRPGDNIYLFGFSRGAHQARALAGMLQQVGLLSRGNHEFVGLAFQIYAHQSSKPFVPGSIDGETMSEAFKRVFSRLETVGVHFIGVWDTVASVGAIIPRNLPFAAGATEISHFRHALALDERRGRFLPQFWLPPTRSEGIPSSHSVKEVWFVGAHANVGGGQTATDGDRTPRLSHISLRWMMREAVEQGLSLDWEALAASPIFAPFVEAGRQLSVLALLERAAEPAVSDDLAPRGDSLSFKVSKSAEGRPRAIVWSRIRNRGLTVFWWLIELSPSIKMEWNLEGQQREWTLRLNLGRGRRIMKDPIFHELVRMRMSALAGDFPPGDGENVVESKYVPKVRLAVGQTMADVRFVD